jgi:Domain of unknown function (DUF4279)
MTINELHASHIGRVAVSFQLSSPALDPDEVTRAIGVSPDLLSVPPSTHGFWSVSSQGKVEGELEAKDINEHIRYLLGILLPHRDAILTFAKGGETYFDVLWESSYLYAGCSAADQMKNVITMNANPRHNK